MTKEEVDKVLAERRAAWSQGSEVYKGRVKDLFRTRGVSYEGGVYGLRVVWASRSGSQAPVSGHKKI